jgi:hypothetical protein
MNSCWWPVQKAAGVVSGQPSQPKLKPEQKYSGLHTLRHFFASWCINRKRDGGLELPIKLVQERLGHSSIVTTSDTYDTYSHEVMTLPNWTLRSGHCCLLWLLRGKFHALLVRGLDHSRWTSGRSHLDVCCLAGLGRHFRGLSHRPPLRVSVNIGTCTAFSRTEGPRWAQSQRSRLSLSRCGCQFGRRAVVSGLEHEISSVLFR